MKSKLLYPIYLLFALMPLTRWFKLRAILLKTTGINCSTSMRMISSARILFTNVSIGKDTFIGHQVLISCNENYKVIIGNNVDLAPRVCIISGSHRIDMDGAHSAGELNGADIIIEDGVWIGANTTVLPGVTIGKKAVIGAGSIVINDIPPFSIAVGNPCKPIKLWNTEKNSYVSLI